MKVPILAGVYADATASFRTSFPVNLEPNIIDSGLSQGTLTDTPGVTSIGIGPGMDRGSINWNGQCFRVMADRLVTVTPAGVVTDLGGVGSNALPVSMDYSFDRLAIASNDGLYYWQQSTGLTQVTDPDLGTVLDVLWIDGYFMTTDGENLVVTELNDPYSVDPLKYGSSEADPDPVVALCKVRGEVYALNRYTIQNFQDIGGTGFPFTNNPGGLVSKGVVGAHAWAYFNDSFAFVGSGRNEQLSVYMAGQGEPLCISNAQVDYELAQLTVQQQSWIECEARIEEGEQRFYLHLPTKTLVYMQQASTLNKQPIWHVLADGANADTAYGPRHMTLLNNKWLVGDASGRLGALDSTVGTRWGDVVGWSLDTVFLYNDGLGGIIKSVELVGLPGRGPTGSTPTCALSMTKDGQNWSQDLTISMGALGETTKRVQWRPMQRFSNYMGMRFHAANTGLSTWAALQIEVEALNV